MGTLYSQLYSQSFHNYYVSLVSFPHTDCFEKFKPIVEIFDFQKHKDPPPIQNVKPTRLLLSLWLKYDYHEEFGKTVRILADSNLAKELEGTHEGIHFASALWAGGKTLA